MTVRAASQGNKQSRSHKQTLGSSSACRGFFSSILCLTFPPAAGTLTEDNRNDVDQDVFLMFTVVNENLSWYLKDNIQKCSDSSGIDPQEPGFVESNLMHGKN